jgi:poly(3-hydroxybutyrate) depolymerase
MAERHFNDYLGTNTMVVYPEPFYFMGAFGFEIGSEEDDFLMVEDLINHIDSNYSIDINDICIGGVSNGGVFRAVANSYSHITFPFANISSFNFSNLSLVI